MTHQIIAHRAAREQQLLELKMRKESWLPKLGKVLSAEKAKKDQDPQRKSVENGSRSSLKNCE